MIAVIGEFSICFTNTVVEGFDGAFRDGVELDTIPDDLDEWRDGDECPRQVLGESESVPGRYRLFRDERQIGNSGFRPTGKNFGGVFDVYPPKRTH
jgi:hypothetical protein